MDEIDQIIDNLTGIGLNVVVIDDDENDFAECPECGAEAYAFQIEEGGMCEECTQDAWEDNNGK